jgi:hypothetical protein
VSLRRDVHTAFDQIAPSTAGMPERVVQTVLSEGAARRRRERFMFRMRAPLSLVAVLLMIAVVGAVLIGGRLYQDWSAQHRPTPGHSPTQPTLAQLEARPLTLALLKPSDECPSGPFDAANDIGAGPLHVIQGQAVDTSWGRYFFLSASTEQGLSGLVLVRAEDARSGQPLVFVGQYAAGPTLGNDTLRGSTVQQHPELVFDISHPPSKGVNGQTFWSFTVGVPKASIGSCFGWQVNGQFNGQAFTETFHS